MPRNGSDVFFLPATYEAITGELIQAQQHNDPLEDLEQDMNTARPIVAGGTGASTAVGGHDAFSTKGANVASATTCDIGAATGMYVHITGTTTITGFGTKTAGVKRIVVFDGILTLTHNGTSLILPTAANITTAAGDVAFMVSEGSGNWKCVAYERANGATLALPSSPTIVTPTITGSALIRATSDSNTGGGIRTEHVSASPELGDFFGYWTAYARDSAGNLDEMASIFAVMIDPTSTQEDALWDIYTKVAGSFASRFRIGAGLFAPTKSDPGVNNIAVATVLADTATIATSATIAGDPVVAAYTGSTQDQTTFPIGHVLSVRNAATNRNQSASLNLHASLAACYAVGGGGAALAGTWRCRGLAGQENDGSFGYEIFQRTA